MYIVAIIVTHNPDVERFRTVIGQVSKQVNRVLVVDNDSKDKNKLIDFCRTAGNCDTYEPPWRYYYIVRNSTKL